MRYRIITMLTWCLFLPLSLLCLPGTAHAGYLDPGSGSILVQSIIAALAAFGRFAARIKTICRFGC